jgi:homoserine O-succinyltransferase
MPDGAFEATERQFFGLLDAGSGCDLVEVSLHTMEGVPRGERAAARIATRYSPLAALREDPPDLMIVTGSNPLEADLADEPYWTEMVDLLEWARQEVPALVLSCLSAHAALAVFDGVTRVRHPSKYAGVFPQRADPTHPLAAGLETPVVLPHSRLNTVPLAAVQAAGYRVALQGEDGEWSAATKTVDRAQVVLVQAHPEYDPSSLLREYHRDARRFALGERDDEPCLPLGCASPADWEQLRRLHSRLIAGERRPELLDDFPFEAAGERASWPWRPAAIRLYANWMAGVPDRSH